MKTGLGTALMLLAVAVCLLAVLSLPRESAQTYSATGRELSQPMPESAGGSIRINSADAEELVQLPGIGETLAQAVLEERETHGPFHYPEDLLTVRGIGPAKLESILPWISLEAEK